MDAFSYLSVLLSIIIGLAIAQVLMGYRALLLSRSRVRLYMPTIVWSVLLLVLATQNWWASFGLRDHERWTFPMFAVILLQTILLYMMSGLVIPDVSQERPVDLKDHYFREARPFFGIMVAMLLVSVLKDVMLDGDLPDGENLAFHAVFGAMALSAFFIRKPLFHEVIAPLMGAAAALYIGLLFARL